MGDELKPPFPPALSEKCGRCGDIVNIHVSNPKKNLITEVNMLCIIISLFIGFCIGFFLGLSKTAANGCVKFGIDNFITKAAEECPDEIQKICETLKEKGRVNEDGIVMKKYNELFKVL